MPLSSDDIATIGGLFSLYYSRVERSGRSTALDFVRLKLGPFCWSLFLRLYRNLPGYRFRNARAEFPRQDQELFRAFEKEMQLALLTGLPVRRQVEAESMRVKSADTAYRNAERAVRGAHGGGHDKSEGVRRRWGFASRARVER